MGDGRNDFSLVCTVAIIIVLRYEDGKELAQWHLRIAPNAVISFLGTIAKSAFMIAVVEIISQLKWIHYQEKSRSLSDLRDFDESSRGPFGSIKLIVKQNRKALLASWAALITVTALLIEPAFQLVFSYPTKLSSVPEMRPEFRATQKYDPNNYFTDGHLVYYTGV